MIEIAHVSKYFGGRTIIDDLSLTIPSQTVFGFLGQNGAGKTTTMKMLVGLTHPDAGSITIGKGAAGDIRTKRHIGFMPEAPYFYDRLTALEFLTFCDELFGVFGKGAAHYDHILESVNLIDARDRRIWTYSKGMKQRLGFAQALVNDPQYIFLDEPLDGLDPMGRREIKEIIKKLKARGKTIFFNSHILFDTEELCDLIGVIDHGRLLYSGSVHEFTQGKTLEDAFVSVIEAQNKHHVTV
jgi:ABC-2 type transport system ATP-binding protein